jgi:hypothetical protein
MATYINGVTDYIPQIQSFQPDLNFYGNVMQAKQGKYDAAKKKVSDLYGSLLYSPMSRENNIKRRDEFFKVIDNDIKRISGLDLSLEQNQDQAMNVFKGFYDDKYMINDMVKTKKSYAEMQRGENFKYCTDTEKCGGQYWDAGMQKLQYKMDEFKKVSDDESMNFDMGSFDPYFDWKDKASKKAKEMGYDVVKSDTDGKWMIKDSNGKLVEKPLYDFFKSLYGDDPRVQSNYDTQAYVTRKNFAKGNALQFGSEEEAEKSYIMKSINEGLAVSNRNLKEIDDSYGQVNSVFLKLDKKINSGGALTPQEQQIYDAASTQREQLNASKNSIQSQIDNIQNNIDTNDINSLRRRADLGAAASFENSDMIGLATSLANIKKSHEITGANPYALAGYNNKLAKELATHNSLLDVWKMKHKFGFDVKLEELKGAIKTNQLPTETYEITGAPWSNIKTDLDKNPSAAYDQRNNDRNMKMAEASAKTLPALFQLYQAAQKAVSANPNENKGAAMFISQFGTDDISTPQELQKAITAKKLTNISSFTGIVNNASIKNNPLGDYSWARSILNQKGGAIDDVKFATEAFNASLNNDLKTNKRLVKGLEGTLSAENPVARHANLLISPVGFLVDEATFIKKYKESNYKKNISSTDDDGKKAYNALIPQFFSAYNSAGETSLRQGVGLTGEGTMSSTPKQFTGLDLLDKGTNKDVRDIITTINEAITKPGTTTVAVGDPSKETLKKGTNDQIADFLTFALNQVDLTDKSKNRTFTAMVSNIAAESGNLSSITLKGIDPGIVKEYEGSKGNKKVFFGEDISKGITVFFDKTQQASPFEKPMSNIETLLRLTNHAESTGYQDTAGKVDWEYNPQTNLVDAIWTPAEYNKETLQWNEAGQPLRIASSDISNIDNTKTFVENQLAIWGKDQTAKGQAIAKYNQAKKAKK